MKTLFLLCASVAFAALNAQTITVRDISTREPIHQAIISDTQNKTVITDIKGLVDITELDKSNPLTIFHSSYLPLQTTYSAEKTEPKEIYLSARMVVLDEVILSANRNQENKIDVPYTINVIKLKEIEFGNQPTSADLLQNTGAVFVQKSQMGGGSPVLRGFEANKVLIVMDGVRMNNAIYRGGHLQDVVTIDPNMLERTEILFGPASTMYGSDALGGVMHFYSKNAEFSNSEKLLVKANAVVRYATVNKEKTAHLDLNFGTKKFASITNITQSDFDDLMSGSGRLAGSSNSWDRIYYAKRLNGRDSMILNPNNNLQVGSAYKQMDIMQKFNIKSGKFTLHSFNIQSSSSSNVPRYDRLSEYSGKNLRFAEWYYGPQKRLLTAYSLNFDKKTAISDNLKLIAAYQKINQERISRRFQNNNRITQKEDVSVFSVNLDAFKRIVEKHELRYGAEVQFNDVKSTANNLQIVTGAISPAATRYANGGNKMTTIGVYVSHALEVDKNFVITDGLRYTNNSLESNFKDTAFLKLPFTSFVQKNQAVTGNLGFTWKEDNDYKVSLMFNTGFRTPNIDDMTKVFESGGGILIVPNGNLKPEYATNFEFGLSKIFEKKYKLDFTSFYTLLENALVLADYKFNGQDSIQFNGVTSRVQAVQNKNKAYVYGFTSGMQLDINKNISIKSTINYTYGRYVDTKTYLVSPLDHIPPIFGQTSFFYKEKKSDVELFVRYNGKKFRADYSTSGEDNVSFSADPVNGYMPAWFTINIRAGYNITKSLRVNASFENMTDNRYRVFSSGINGPGKNFIISLRYKV